MLVSQQIKTGLLHEGTHFLEAAQGFRQQDHRRHTVTLKRFDFDGEFFFRDRDLEQLHQCFSTGFVGLGVNDISTGIFFEQGLIQLRVNALKVQLAIFPLNKACEVGINPLIKHQYL